MKLLERAEISLDWLDANTLYDHPYPRVKRSVGTVHVSEIIRDIAVKSGLLTDADKDDAMPVCVLLGMGWEMACAKLYPEMEWQPGEVERDGVVGSPDGLSLVGQDAADVVLVDKGVVEYGEPIIDEFKYTKKSCRKPGGSADDYKDLAEDWLWATQVKCYCAQHEMAPRLVRFHVLWSRGNYDYKSGGVKERYIRYLYRLEDAEVEKNWAMIVNHAKGRVSASAKPVESKKAGPKCKACAGSGVSSKGGVCHPCKGKGTK